MATSKVWNKNDKLVEEREIDTVSGDVDIVSLLDARIIVTGTVTGRRYEFARAGAVVSVDVKDKDELLNKKKGRACCGGDSYGNVFQLA